LRHTRETNFKLKNLQDAMNYDNVWLLSNVELGMLWVQSIINHGLWMVDLDATSGKL
jgi:hypothetical protein